MSVRESLTTMNTYMAGGLSLSLTGVRLYVITSARPRPGEGVS